MQRTMMMANNPPVCLSVRETLWYFIKTTKRGQYIVELLESWQPKFNYFKVVGGLLIVKQLFKQLTTKLNNQFLASYKMSYSLQHLQLQSRAMKIFKFVL